LSGEGKRSLRQKLGFAPGRRRDAMRVVASMLALAVALTFVGKLMAADEAAPKAKPHQHGAALGVLKGVDLTAEQKKQVAAVMKEYAPKLKEMHQKVDGILTAEQKKAREEAVTEAKAAGKKGADLYKAIHGAVKLTAEQKAQMGEVRKEMSAVQKEMNAKLLDLLTPEQKEQLKAKAKSKAKTK
jgi:Spy/CpxP family protein refolding chaperone